MGPEMLAELTQENPIPSTQDPLDWALYYARKGWFVVPVQSGRKEPLTKNGLLDASTDEAVIREWWERWPGANIGLAMRRSGLLAIDVDSHKPDDNGHETLAALEAELGLLPDTIETRTPGGVAGGRHLIFRHPQSPVVSSRNILGAGLDVRDDAYLVAPPSIHPGGGRYIWREGRDPAAIGPATPPRWLLDKLQVAAPDTVGTCDVDTTGPIHRLLHRLSGVHRAGSGWKARCPAHNDRNPSLSISEASDGRVLLHCHAGCSFEAVLQSLGIESRDLFPSPGSVSGNGRRPRGGRVGPTPRETLIRAPFSDLGNAERLRAVYGRRIRYCLERGWLVWNGSVWEQDPGPLVQGLASRTARATLKVASSLENPEQRKALVKHALHFESSRGTAGAVSLARGFDDLQLRAEALDADPWVLNTPTGLVDLKTGELRPHDPSAYCTKITGVPIAPTSDCPRWEQFLLEILNGDVELAYFLKRAIGYALTGSTSEQVLFFLWGAGANGKTVLLETLRFVLGAYAKSTPMALWLSDRNERANSATPDLAALQGARFVTSIESNAERRLNEGLVKGATGGDRVSARELFGQPFEFTFQGKIFCASNHRPVIKGTDEGIWRRFILIPFTRTFPPEERDKNLLDKLKAEAPEILRWAVEGCLEWQESGLRPPEQVRIASQEYREEQDCLGVWLAERCIQDPNVSSPTADLYRDFSQWAEQGNDDPMTIEAFGKALGNRGFASQRTKKTRLRRGVALKDREAQGNLMDSEKVTGDR